MSNNPNQFWRQQTYLHCFQSHFILIMSSGLSKDTMLLHMSLSLVVFGGFVYNKNWENKWRNKNKKNELSSSTCTHSLLPNRNFYFPERKRLAGAPTGAQWVHAPVMSVEAPVGSPGLCGGERIRHFVSRGVGHRCGSDSTPGQKIPHAPCTAETEKKL